VNTESNWLVIADALRQAGLDLSRVVRSKHSVDILASGVDKSHLVAHVIQEFKIEPYEILAMGDQGAWPGNDSTLLEHRFSLSVDVPTRRLDRGWKLAPNHKRDVDATLWYLDHIQLEDDGRFRIQISAIGTRDR
jgi:hydroxymethylpyrimidine pyrophosphatase-like HAD family hydrolase